MRKAFFHEDDDAPELPGARFATGVRWGRGGGARGAGHEGGDGVAQRRVSGEDSSEAGSGEASGRRARLSGRLAADVAVRTWLGRRNITAEIAEDDHGIGYLPAP